MADAPLACSQRRYAGPNPRWLRAGAISVPLVALAFTALVCVPAAVPSALAGAGAQEASAVAHEALGSAPAALRKAVESSLGAGRTAPLTSRFSSTGARLSLTSGPFWLGLGSIGRPGALTAVPATKPVQRGGETLYRSTNLTEWFRDHNGALEQGFTVWSRPAGDGPLVIALSGDGLTAHYGTRGALVLRRGSRAVLGYGNLEVRDATGSAVAARLVPWGQALRIVVDDARATYPLYIDPTWSQQAELTASDGASGFMGSGDNFGRSVSLSGTTALVGAYDHKVGSNAEQGAAYIFTESGGTWSQQAELTASDGAAGDMFGMSVSLSGTTALVGAEGHKVGANTDQGAAYVFTESGGTWSQQAELTACAGAGCYNFGTSVSLSGTTALIGAPGSNADQGAAYIFTGSGGTWSQQAELTASDGAADEIFGVSVSLSGTAALVGAEGHKVGSNTDQGAAYVFTNSGGTWSQQAELTASDGAAADVFGTSVSLSGTTAVIGSYAHQVGSNPHQGAAYIFTGSGGTWSQQAELTASDGTGWGWFGTSVSLSGTTAVVGAEGTGSSQGAAYVFTSSGGAWSQQAELTASDGASNDDFGSSVSLSGTAALVGEIGYNSWQGSAYVFQGVLAAPTVSSVSPSGGPVAGSTAVTVSGTGFVVGATTATFGTTTATISCSSSTSCTVTSPSGPAGTVDITLTTSAGTSATSTADQFSYDPVPAVTSVSPAAGSLTGSTAVTVSGTGFVVGNTTASFGTTAAAISCSSTTSCTATAPAGSAGTVDITVSTPGGTSVTSTADRFSYDPVPTVTGVSPSTGSVAGGTVVTVTGAGFVVGSTTASFGLVAGTALDCTSNTSCAATSPAAIAGAVDITLTTPGGTSATSTADQFSYNPAPTVTGVNPNAGGTAGGTVVAITGTGFVTGSTTASFGGTAATAVSCTSSTSCTATSPAAAAGEVHITLTTPDGTSATTFADAFTYDAPPPSPPPAPASSAAAHDLPTITAISPGTGPASGGTVITITGTNFVVGWTTANFGASAATAVNCSSNTSCTAMSPARPPGTVEVRVVTSVGTSALGGADQFSFEAASPPASPTTRASRPGYWTVTRAGHVCAGGSARYQGSVKNRVGAVVGIASVPAGTGYWAVTAVGRIYSYGSARYHGSVENAVGPVVGIASASGRGYWAVTAVGRVYSYGSARYHGGLNEPTADVVAIAALPGGAGYWLVTAAGTVYAFGSAHNYGSVENAVGRVVGIADGPSGKGYWVVTARGRVYAFGAARYFGGEHLAPRLAVAGITAARGGKGYWLAGADGAVFGFGSASSLSAAPRAGTTVVGIAGA
jgi:hypothetical protein